MAKLLSVKQLQAKTMQGCTTSKGVEISVSCGAEGARAKPVQPCSSNVGISATGKYHPDRDFQ